MPGPSPHPRDAGARPITPPLPLAPPFPSQMQRAMAAVRRAQQRRWGGALWRADGRRRVFGGLWGGYGGYGGGAGGRRRSGGASMAE